MAGFDFNQVDNFVSESDGKINFLKLADDGCYAKVRFMYGAGETFRGETVHNISEDPTRPRYVVCLREEGQPLDACPLCANGQKFVAQFFVPVYVQSIVSVDARGLETEQQVGQVMVFQRGATFKGALQSVIRNIPQGTQIVNSMFRLVRNGKARDPKTTYSVEYMGTDNVGLENLPPRPEVVGSYILPKLSYEEIVEKYINKTAQPAPTPANAGIQPRTLNASTFGGNVGFGNQATATQTFNQPMNNTNQVPVQAPQIGSGNVPF